MDSPRSALGGPADALTRRAGPPGPLRLSDAPLGRGTRRPGGPLTLANLPSPGGRAFALMRHGRMPVSPGHDSEPASLPTPAGPGESGAGETRPLTRSRGAIRRGLAVPEGGMNPHKDRPPTLRVSGPAAQLNSESGRRVMGCHSPGQPLPSWGTVTA
jgi:hypothetical protein